MSFAERAHVRNKGAPSSAGLLMAGGLTFLALPTLVTIAHQGWTDEQAQQGPLVLVLGVWLLWRAWPEVRRSAPGNVYAAAAALLLCGAAYGLGRLSELALVEAYALFGFLIASVYALSGFGGVRRAGFPLLLLAFAVPIPFAVGWPLTTALRLGISDATAQVMDAIGVPAARDGLTIYLAGYRIEIAQACSGMNSLLALTALGVCYIHLRRAPPLTYLLVLLPLIVAAAVAANFLRVFMLAALTVTLGDGVAQGSAHQLLGLATFAIALGLTFSADELAGRSGVGRAWTTAG